MRPGLQAAGAQVIGRQGNGGNALLQKCVGSKWLTGCRPLLLPQAPAVKAAFGMASDKM